jgi:general secretion pathway protein G
MRKLCAEPRHSGASRFELLVAVSVIAVSATVLLERLLFYQEYAEKVAMELTVANMRAGMRARIATLLIADRMSEISSLADENPVSWLDRKPENYLGEFEGAPGFAQEGKWFFDRRGRELVYTANNRRFFIPSAYRDYTVRVRVMRVSPVMAATSKARSNEPEWVTLVIVNDYRWF